LVSAEVGGRLARYLVSPNSGQERSGMRKAEMSGFNGKTLEDMLKAER